MRERHECHCMLFLTEDNDFAGEETVRSVSLICSSPFNSASKVSYLQNSSCCFVRIYHLRKLRTNVEAFQIRYVNRLLRLLWVERRGR